MPWDGPKRQHSPRRRSHPSDYSSSSSSDHDSIPYTEATPDSGEIPLTELETFIVPAQDDKGAHVHIRFNIPPALERAIKLILHSNRFPYLDLGYLVRHAVTRHIAFLTNLRMSLPRHMVINVEMINEMARDYELHAQVEDALRAVAERVERLLKDGEEWEAVRLLSMVVSRADDAFATARQRKLKAEVYRRFGHLMGMGTRGEMGHGESRGREAEYQV